MPREKGIEGPPSDARGEGGIGQGSPTGRRLTVGPFPGWETVPTW